MKYLVIKIECLVAKCIHQVNTGHSLISILGVNLISLINCWLILFSRLKEILSKFAVFFRVHQAKVKYVAFEYCVHGTKCNDDSTLSCQASYYSRVNSTSTVKKQKCTQNLSFSEQYYQTKDDVTCLKVSKRQCWIIVNTEYSVRFSKCNNFTSRNVSKSWFNIMPMYFKSLPLPLSHHNIIWNCACLVTSV